MNAAHLFRELISQCLEGTDLQEEQVAEAVEALTTEDDQLELKAEFLQVLGGKGESSAEIGAFVRALLAKAVRPEIDYGRYGHPVIDVVGTGGDKLGMFNVSTTAMFVIAAGGVGIIKHGNRGITSKSGGADVLEALGVSITLGPELLVRCFEATGLAFVFAPLYHPAFKAIGPVRKLLADRGIPTVFNKLGPLLNPAQPPYQLAGVFSPGLMGTYASVLAELGRERAWVIHGRVLDENGNDLGADELTPLGINLVQAVEKGKKGEAREISPELLPSLQPCTLANLSGAGADFNATLLRAILSGEERGPKRDTALLNAAAGLVVAGKAPTLAEGFALAGELVDNGAALAKLEAFSSFRP
jgi:anthranilate phosphoribosyltransferase